MKIIYLSTEQNLFKKESKVFERIKEYSVFAKENIYLVFTKNKNNLEISEKFGENLFRIIPIFGKNKIQQIYNLFKFFRKEISSKNKSENKNEEKIISSQDAFEIGFLSFLLAKKFRAKLLIQIHTDISTKFFRKESLRNFLQFLLANFVLKKADKIRLVSKKMEKYLLENLKINKNKIFLLPIYTDYTIYKSYKNFSKINFSEKAEIKILMLSRMEKVKNIPLGISVVEKLRENTKRNITLKIVGDGSLKKKYLEKYTNSKNFWLTFEDWTENVEEKYSEADLFLITSNYEGWGMTAVESVACGTPVVMTPVGLAHEFIINGVNGFVAKSYSEKDMLCALDKALDFEFDKDAMI